MYIRVNEDGVLKKITPNEAWSIFSISAGTIQKSTNDILSAGFSLAGLTYPTYFHHFVGIIANSFGVGVVHARLEYRGGSVAESLFDGVTSGIVVGEPRYRVKSTGEVEAYNKDSNAATYSALIKFTFQNTWLR